MTDSSSVDGGLDEGPLPWHRPLWRQVAAWHRRARFPHGVLCTGPPGVGKEAFARRLAQGLLCSTHRDGQPCGACRSCKLWAVGHHPDGVLIAPEADDKAIKVEAIRGLGEFMAHTANAGVKVALMLAAHHLNPSAANALLKTLEEPPGNGVLLLVTAFPGRLPATVRSRCQRLAVARPPKQEALAWLAARGLTAGEGVLAQSLGAPLKALALAPREPRRRALFEAFTAVAAGRLDPLEAAATLAAEEPREALEWLISWHRDLVRLKMQATLPLENGDLAATLTSLANDVPFDVLWARLDHLQRLWRRGSGPVNTTLALESFLASWAPLH
ncbi:MAG: DNA polymerase III subunit delta' C-terminal domain-containing protein [Candidatus Competibacterales bacterium]